ncbi:sel1 repeat family protein [Histomonas meleagridis]|uniref:sel1 repeat family protein n=1 Tax=Histomonas meleagridis TaxID=135588 RepID=UPI00355A30EA|nr:sel1 repeat family protein [Histomonas meleagridis]KAH0796679.1 sel1 repeat family protein [Histomonas meleagridis]
MNDTIAREYYEKGSELGNPEAQANLAFFLRYGIGGDKDLERASELDSSASPIVPWSKLSKASSYLYSTSQMSCDTSFNILKQVADSLSEGMTFFDKYRNTGVQRFPDQGSPNDRFTLKESLLEFTKSNAKRGDPISILKLGLLYIQDRNYKSANKYVTMAANLGVPASYAIAVLMAMNDLTSTVDQELLSKYIYEGLRAGDTLMAVVTSQLLTNDKNFNDLSKKNFIAAVASGHPEALFLKGIQKLNKAKYNRKKAKEAYELFKRSYRIGNILALYEMAIVMHRYLSDEISCSESFSTLLRFCENTIIFEDEAIAWNAFVNKDYEYAYRIYQRLSDMGSENATYNAEKIAALMGREDERRELFDKQVKMNSANALTRLGEEVYSAGQVNEALYLWEKASFRYAKSNFLRAMEIRNNDMVKAAELLKETASQNKNAKIPVEIAKVMMFFEALPKTIISISRNDFDNHCVKFVVNTLKENAMNIVFVVLTICLYALVAMRVKTFFRVTTD